MIYHGFATSECFLSNLYSVVSDEASLVLTLVLTYLNDAPQFSYSFSFLIDLGFVEFTRKLEQRYFGLGISNFYLF